MNQKLSCLLAVSLTITSAVLGQTSSTWLGGSGDWSTPGNWTPSGVPNNGGSVYDVTIITNPTTVTLTGPITIRDLIFSGNYTDPTSTIITGDHDLTLTGNMSWQDAMLGGNGTLTIGAGHTLTALNQVYLSGGRSINNAGTATINALYSDFTNGGTINNSGRLTIDSTIADTTGSAGGPAGTITLNNSGTLELGLHSSINLHNSSTLINTGVILTPTGGTGAAAATISTPGMFTNSSAGTINFRGTSIQVSSGIGNAGILAGFGEIIGSVENQNGGRISPSGGTLTITNGLTVVDGSVFNFSLNQVGDGTPLIVGNSLSVSGFGAQVTVNITGGGSFGAGTYELIHGTSTGAGFNSNLDSANLMLGSAPTGFDYEFHFDGTILSLNVTASAIPEPATSAGFAAVVAGAVVVTVRRRRIAQAV